MGFEAEVKKVLNESCRVVLPFHPLVIPHVIFLVLVSLALSVLLQCLSRAFVERSVVLEVGKSKGGKELGLKNLLKYTFD